MKPFTFNAAAGVRNDVPLVRYAKGDLSAGVNVDIDETGAISRRLGYSVLSAGAAHSLWSDNTVAFFVQGGALRQLFPDLTSRVVQTGITGQDVDFTSAAGQTFWSDAVQSGIIQDGVARRWGLAVPQRPVLSTTGGDLQPGVYGCTLTYARADGHESGAPVMSWVHVEPEQGLTVGLSPSPDALVIETRIYLTLAGGDTAYLAATVPPDVTSVTFTAQPPVGAAVRTMFMGPAPAGQLVSSYNGCMYVAQDNFLFYTPPFEYELFDQRSGFLSFASRITMFAPTIGGVFLGTSTHTIFLEGMGPESFVARPLAPVGVVEGTSHIVRGDVLAKDNEPEPVVLWLSTKGVTLGSPGGVIKNLTGDRWIMPSAPAQGSSLLKIKDGTPHFMTTFT
jgi:hypothetical protein